MNGTRRVYTQEFKQDAVALVARHDKPAEQVARELGIDPSPLRRWRRTRTAGGRIPPSGCTPRCPHATTTAGEYRDLLRDRNPPNRRIRTRTFGGVGGDQRTTR
ncbi:MAG: hypothetical protein CAF45_011715 [Nitrospira sp. CG24E]|nr:MAG: hypothetical protein CAF45_011715 [Nitrospira sp. CG24E]